MIISLTTVPGRIKYIKPVIDSLKRQTKPVSKILLWVPHLRNNRELYNIPNFLQEDDLVEIKRCNDVGPATKFLYTVKQLKTNEEFIVIDDDKIYNKNLIKDLTRFPDIDCPKGIVGVYLYEDERRAAGAPARRIQMNLKERKHPSRLPNTTVLRGSDGILLKPKYFNTKLIKKSLQSPWSTGDDIWMSVIFKINNIRPRIVPVLQKPYNTPLSFHSEIGGGKYETLQTYNNIYEYLTNEK